MQHLQGFKEYLRVADSKSVFDQALTSQESWEMHLHNQRVIQARVVENRTHEIIVDIAGEGTEELSKIQVKYLNAVESAAEVSKMVKIDKKVQALGLEPIQAPIDRHFVKNKTLFPLMKEREVVFCTLLEGELIRGLVAEFSRYDLTIHAKGGLPIVVMRHSIYDFRNKQGRCLLKSYQDQHKDWQKSALFVSE